MNFSDFRVYCDVEDGHNIPFSDNWCHLFQDLFQAAILVAGFAGVRGVEFKGVSTMDEIVTWYSQDLQFFDEFVFAYDIGHIPNFLVLK